MVYTGPCYTRCLELQSRNKQLTTIAQNITAKTDTKKGQRYHTNKELETNNTLQL